MTLDELKARAKADLDNAFEKGKAQGGGGGDFWNTFMGMKSFTYAFYNWDTSVFTPNIELAFKGDCSRAFYYFNNDKTETVDMIEHLKKCGASLNFSNATGTLSFIFATTKITALPTLDFSKATKLDGCFNNSPIETIEKIILKSDGTQTFTNITFNCRANVNADYTLRNITFEGVIGKDIWFDCCPYLTAESYHSIITHCSKTANFTVTLPPYDTVRTVYDAKYGERAWGNILKEYPNVTVVYS